MTPIIQFGLETEIGISRDSAEEIDVVAESIALVRSAAEPGVWMCWDYGSEDPHADVRGFRVRELRQDSDEADYFAQDAERELSYVEMKSDLVLDNGARFYNDHAHPEYCTPECSTYQELITRDRAGERILMDCAEHLSEVLGSTVRLYKNNTDFLGHSYGCHENYLLPRSLAWDVLARGIKQAFLVTRQIIAGAGKFAIESEDKFVSNGFQIAQRSDFFSELQSVDTMQRRPLINTRDEPHANPKLYRRFHVILGDANMSPFATRLKVGTTALVLEALVRDPKRLYPQLDNPIGTLPAISRDPTFRWELSLQGHKPSTALRVQRQYLTAVKDLCDLNSERQALVQDWETVLNDLEADYWRCRNRLDWVAKLGMVRDFQASQNVSDDDPWLQSLDLEYHRLDLKEGLYYGLEQSGAMLLAPDERAVEEAMRQPPPTTRAYVRGKCVHKFPGAVSSAQWDHITLEGSDGPIKLSLLDLFAPQEILHYARRVDAARSPDDLRDLADVPR